MNPKDDYNRRAELIRYKEFPTLKDVTYLDHAGTTLAARSQLEAHHRDIISNIYGNPHSRNPSSQITTDTIDQVRYRILKYFNTSPEEYTVIFTSGCTGALKLVAESFDFYGFKSPICHGNQAQSGKEETSNVKDTSEVKELLDRTVLVDSRNENRNSNSQLNTKNYDCSCYDSNVTGCHGNITGSYKKGSFVYLLDNHTSVQGMREIAFARAGRVCCVECDKDNVISKEHVLGQSDTYQTGGNYLFAYPAQSNFSGQKYPMNWISEAQNGQLGKVTLSEGCCYVLLDAACLVSTSPLDLGYYKPDFVTMSFYKMFGYPTGLGALLVLNKSCRLLRKTYYGGGTVSVSLSTQRFHILRPSMAERFEDGTVSFLDIVSLRHGFEALQSQAGGISSISNHTFSVTRYFYRNLRSLHHCNGRALAEIYCHGNFEDLSTQGAIVTFNCIRANGEYIGFSEVDKLAQLYNIHFRTGCFCNLGACQKFLNISDQELKENFDAGHVCGDDKDLINGKPTGAIRVSFGYMSTLKDAQICLKFLVDCFLENPDKPDFVEEIMENQSALAGSENIMDQTRDLTLGSEETEKRPVSLKESVLESAALSKSVKDSDVKVIPDQMPVPNTIDPSAIKYNTKLESDYSGTKDKDICLNMKTATTVTDQIKDEKYTTFERTLTDIFVYPIKSCAAFKAQAWPLSDRGLLYDREWMIVTESGVALGLKRETKLCLLQPSIDLDLQVLVLNYPGVEPVSVSLIYAEKNVQETSLCSSKVCGDRYKENTRVQSVDCGQEVSDWLSKALDRPGCRLIRQKADDKRKSKVKQSGNDDSPAKLTLANESQYLLLSRATVDLLKDVIEERCENGDSAEPIDTENLLHRFRGNLVVAGGNPFDEETWQSLQIGATCFKCQGSCTRCQMVCFDPWTGEKSKEPLKTLAVWRERKMTFGVYLYCCEDFSTGTKMIRVGDAVVPC